MEVKEPSARYRLQSRYKQTELGPIPEDWEVTRVGVEFSVQLGKMLDSEKNRGVPKPFLGNRAVQWGKFDLSDVGEIRLMPDDLQRYRLRDGDLLVCEGGEVGRCAIWRLPLAECYYQKALHRLRPLQSYSPELLAQVLRWKAESGALQNFVTRTSIAHLPKDKFESVPIPLPPTGLERQAITDALTDADAFIESLEQLLAKKRQLKQGAMQELLTGKRRLPGFKDEWRLAKLGEFGGTYGGLSGKSKKDFGHGAARYITFMNIMSNVVINPHDFESVDVGAEENQNRVIRGDLFFNGSSETPEEVGLCAVLDANVESVYLNSFCFGFRFRAATSASAKYLAYLFRSGTGRELVKSLAQGATRYNLSKTSLLRVQFAVPGFEEQTAIATILSDLDTELEALEAQLTKARHLKQGMMQALLTGRIRLV